MEQCSYGLKPVDGACQQIFEQLIDTWFPAAVVTLQPLREQVQVLTLPAGRAVFHQGDACEMYLVVLQGSVRVQALTESGREIVLYRVRDHESCVITTACLLGEEVYPADGITETETTALALARGVFEQGMALSASFRRFVFHNQGSRLSDLIRRVEDVAYGRLDAKLARCLLDLAGAKSSVIKLTHQQLAMELGSAREVVSRHLKQFEQAGWIETGRGSLTILRPAALEKLLQGGG